MFDFSTRLNRKNSDSIKWSRYRNTDVLPFWVADMDFATPKFVLDAIRHRLEHPILGYSDIPPELTQAFIQWALRHFNWSIQEEWVLWLPSVVGGLNVAVRAVGKEDDHCVIPIPIYPPFLTIPELNQRIPTLSNLILENNRWVMDLNDIEKKTEQASTLLISNPQNPTGRAYSKTELQELGNLCVRNNTVIVSDEIHWGIILNPATPHTPIATISEAISQQTITLISHTKTYNIPGEPCAVAVISNPELRESFRTWGTRMLPICSPLALAGATASFCDTSSYLVELNQYLRDNRDLLVTAVNDSERLHVTTPEATYLAWIDVRNLSLADPITHFEQHGLGLYDGSEFGVPGFVRFNFAVPRLLLSEGIERLLIA